MWLVLQFPPPYAMGPEARSCDSPPYQSVESGRLIAQHRIVH